MSERQSRPLWPLSAALIGLPVLYVLSIGPLAWLVSNNHLSLWSVRLVTVYVWPFQTSFEFGPEWWRDLLRAYLDLWK